MKKLGLIFVFLLTSIIYSQNKRVTLEDAQEYMKENRTRIRKISLCIKRSKRVSFNDVSILIRNTLKEVKVYVSTGKALVNDEQWRDAKIDTTFIISKKEFTDISEIIKKIDPFDIQQNFGYEILDGYSYNLEFGGIKNSLNYKVSSPTSKKDSPDYIPYYLEACKLIVGRTGLDWFNGTLH